MAKTTTVRHELPFRVRLIKDIRKNYPLYLMALPAIVMIFLLSYVPMYGVLMAFQDFRPVRGILGSDWVGLENFRRFFNDFFRYFFNYFICRQNLRIFPRCTNTWTC